MMGKTLDFKPPWWLRNKHMQSVYASVIPKPIPVALRWEELNLPDGDFIDLAWTGPVDAPIVVLLHGVEGSVASHYIQEMMRNFLDHGMQVVTMHFRSCSGRMNRLAPFYDGGDIRGDFKFLVDTLNRRHPNLPIFAMGFSMGGNVLMRYLAHHHDSPLRAAVSVSMPFELDKSSDYLIPFYQHVLLRSLKKKLEIKFNDGLVMPIKREILKDMHTVRDFDSMITAPTFGYQTVEEYYQDASSRRYLKDVKHPGMIFHAMDDPFVPADSMPEAKELSPTLTLDVSQNGGHMGFLKGGLPWRPAYWLTQRIHEFFNKLQ
ncbi:MAG: alpha/beta fold hydrolase [Gammaproteobacteria bacterium]|nr:alpha/beta fold hydrolase [Gammaproteobacteria bacterium]MCH9744817.1 alpha/beta fold hydrolase [Gammaproteobacteria bacterium]